MASQVWVTISSGDNLLPDGNGSLFDPLLAMVSEMPRSSHWYHYSDVIMSAMASQITGVSIVYSTFCSGAGQRKHQSSALLAICARNSPVTGEFSAQRASNAENVSICWRHHYIFSRNDHNMTDKIVIEINNLKQSLFQGQRINSLGPDDAIGR